MTCERLIFLDVDGVLRTWPSPVPFHDSADGRRGASYNPACVAALNWLVAASQARLVISSTWRVQGRFGMQRDLDSWGVHARIYSMLPRDQLPPRGSYNHTAMEHWLATTTRARQIEHWLGLYMQRHPGTVTRGVALDDEDTRAVGVSLVQTTIAEGLTWMKARQALAILRE
jgi:hypothetical protein